MPHTLLPEDSFNIILLSTPEYSKYSLSLRFPHQNPVYTSPRPKRATCSAHLILLNLMDRITFGELTDRSAPRYAALCHFVQKLQTVPVLRYCRVVMMCLMLGVAGD